MARKNNKHSYLSLIDKDINEKVDAKIQKTKCKSKNFVINQLLQMWVNDEVEINL